MSDPSSSPTNLRLVVDAVRKEYDSAAGKLVVLNGVSFSLSAGESLAVVGPSGSGKSTLLNIIGSLDRPTSGQVSLGTLDVTKLDAAGLADYRSTRVGFVFQDHHLLPQCTAIENVMLPTLAARSAGDSRERAASLLERVGLRERMSSFPAQMSGGERQRVAVARALVNDPPLLLCDEPTGNLDRESAEQVASLFIELVRERRVCLIIVTHNLALAGRFSRCLELRGGVLQDPS